MNETPDVDMSAQSDFEDWGVIEPEADRETQTLEGSTAFVDDRREPSSEGEQANLLIEIGEQQQTLTGGDQTYRSEWSE